MTIVARSFEEIEEKADALLAGVQSPPVSVTRIAKRLSVHLEAADLSGDVSGVLVVRKKSGVIGYNRRHVKERQRFSIAHELGHYVLHRSTRELFIDNAAFFRSDASAGAGDPREREANVFAAALLMPRRLVLRSARRHNLMESGSDAIAALASEFRVSSQAMTFRLMNLGLV